MSPELIATVGIGVTIIAGMFGGFGWMIHRIDRVEARLGDRITQVETRLGDRIAQVETKLDRSMDRLGDRVDVLAHEVTDVKITIARLEGPAARLHLAR